MPEKTPISPTAMSPNDAIRVLSAVGKWPISQEMLDADFARGAPRNGDGTLNLVHYAAWLVKELADGNQSAATATE